MVTGMFPLAILFDLDCVSFLTVIVDVDDDDVAAADEIAAFVGVTSEALLLLLLLLLLFVEVGAGLVAGVLASTTEEAVDAVFK